MELLLMGLGGCSAIDVVLILKKARQTVVDFRIEVEGQREVDAIPAPFEKIHIKYFFKGDLKPKKVEDAIRLSMEKYCSATVMLAKSAEITWSYEIEEMQ
jgi:putative redox protein